MLWPKTNSYMEFDNEKGRSWKTSPGNLQANSGLEGILSKHFFFCPEEGFKVPIALSLFAVNDPSQLPSVNLDISLRSTVTHTEELGQS